MTLEKNFDPISGERAYTLRFSERDLTRVRLRPGDRLILDDCDAPDATIADRLLGLELLARRIGETT